MRVFLPEAPGTHFRVRTVSLYAEGVTPANAAKLRLKVRSDSKP